MSAIFLLLRTIGPGVVTPDVGVVHVIPCCRWIGVICICYLSDRGATGAGTLLSLRVVASRQTCFIKLVPLMCLGGSTSYFGPGSRWWLYSLC